MGKVVEENNVKNVCVQLTKSGVKRTRPKFTTIIREERNLEVKYISCLQETNKDCLIDLIKTQPQPGLSKRLPAHINWSFLSSTTETIALHI